MGNSDCAMASIAVVLWTKELKRKNLGFLENLYLKYFLQKLRGFDKITGVVKTR